MRRQIEEVNAIKIEERGGNKSSPKRNSERLGKTKYWTTFPGGFWHWDFSPKDNSDHGRRPSSGKGDTCYLSKGRLASIPASVRKHPWEDASRSSVFLFGPPGLTTTADEAGPMVAFYTHPMEGERPPVPKCASARLGCIIPCRVEIPIIRAFSPENKQLDYNHGTELPEAVCHGRETWTRCTQIFPCFNSSKYDFQIRSSSV